MGDEAAGQNARKNFSQRFYRIFCPMGAAAAQTRAFSARGRHQKGEWKAIEVNHPQENARQDRCGPTERLGVRANLILMEKRTGRRRRKSAAGYIGAARGARTGRAARTAGTFDLHQSAAAEFNRKERRKLKADYSM